MSANKNKKTVRTQPVAKCKTFGKGLLFILGALPTVITSLIGIDSILTNRIDLTAKANNCTFIHRQIRATEQEIEYPSGIVVYKSDPKWQLEQEAKKANLERRLRVYQQQLGICRS